MAENTASRFLDRIEQAYELIDNDYALDIFVYTAGEYAVMLDQGNTLIQTAEKEGRVLYERPAA